MSELISRQAAMDLLGKQIEQCDRSLSSFDISMKDEYAAKVEKASLTAFRETLEYMPPAQPQRTGKWIKGHCSECGDHAPYWAMSSAYYGSKFCPHCGAKMEGDAE